MAGPQFTPEAYGETNLEPLRWSVEIDTAASGVLLPVQVKTGWVDDNGTAGQAGGAALVEGDSSIKGGRLGPREMVTIFGQQCWTHYDDHAAVVPDAEWQALFNVCVLYLEIDKNSYELGKLIEYIGPIQTKGAMQFIRAFRQAKEIAAASSMRMVVKVNRALSAGVVASKKYVINGELPCLKQLVDGAAVKS